MIYFLALLMSLSLFWAPTSFAGYKDVDTKIAEQEINSHITNEDARFTLRLQKGGFEKGVVQGMWDADGKLTGRATAAKLKSLKRSGTGDLLISSQNADIKVKVTDIKEMNMGMKFKQAKFVWQYSQDVPSLWKRFVVAGGQVHRPGAGLGGQQHPNLAERIAAQRAANALDRFVCFALSGGPGK